MMLIEIRTSLFDPWAEIKSHQHNIGKHGQYGATASFVGSMRDFNNNESIKSMTLEHYPGMTEKHLEKICCHAQQKWDILDILLLHRVGQIKTSEPIVLICVWSAHRAEAFAACCFILEDLKSKAPFWKQELTSKGQRWVKRNTA